jgi:hypothetical protein
MCGQYCSGMTPGAPAKHTHTKDQLGIINYIYNTHTHTTANKSKSSVSQWSLTEQRMEASAIFGRTNHALEVPSVISATIAAMMLTVRL